MARSLELDTAFTYGRMNYAVFLSGAGKTDSAVALLTSIEPSTPPSLKVFLQSVKILVLMEGGRNAEAMALYKRLHDAITPATATPYVMIYLHGAARNADSTLFWLNKGIDTKSGGIFVQSVPCNPFLQFLEPDPRFHTALARMGVQRCRK